MYNNRTIVTPSNETLRQFWTVEHQHNEIALELSQRMLGRFAIEGQLEFDVGEAIEFEDKD